MKLLNYLPRIFIAPTTDNHVCKLEFHSGDELWKSSIWLTFRWFGKYKNYWIVIFLW